MATPRREFTLPVVVLPVGAAGGVDPVVPGGVEGVAVEVDIVKVDKFGFNSVSVGLVTFQDVAN